MGIRLMIIELGIYNLAKELLIETRTAGSQGHVCYQNGDWRVSVTGAAVRMEEEGTGMRTGDRGAYNLSPSQVSELVARAIGVHRGSDISFSLCAAPTY